MLITIPAYKQPEKLVRCIEAIKAQTCHCEPEVIDNSDTNRGFTAACNVGLRLSIDCRDEFAAICNQDLYLHPHAVFEAIGLMHQHPRCAIVGIKQFSAADPDLITHGGCAAAYPAGVHKVGRKSAGDHTISLPQPWVNGAFMLFRRAALREIGLMDEAMFLVGSDSDICYTARLRGWEVWYCAAATAVHEDGGVSAAPSEDLKPIIARDMQYWSDKWRGGFYDRLRVVDPIDRSDAIQVRIK